MSEIETSVQLPTQRLGDVIRNLETKNPAVLNLDACLPVAKNAEILGYILGKICPSVKVLSVRFNNITDEGASILAEWLESNSSIEVMYIMGNKISSSARQSIETAFYKNLVGHSVSNGGNTLNRVNTIVVREQV